MDYACKANIERGDEEEEEKKKKKKRKKKKKKLVGFFSFSSLHAQIMGMVR